MYKKAYIEITNICNLSCSFCAKSNLPKQYISVSKFAERLEQASKFTRYMYLHILGEPLLHPELDAILDVCDKFYVYINIVTNGTLIATNTDILNNHKCIRKVAFSLQSYLANEITIPLTNYLQPIINFINSSSAIIELRLLNQWDNSSISEYLSQSLPSGRENLFLTFSDTFNWPETKQEGNVKYCKGLIDQFAILVDGTVVPCCLDCNGIISLGNIDTQPLSTILSNSRAESIRQGFYTHKPSELLCRSCSYAERFG